MPLLPRRQRSCVAAGEGTSCCHGRRRSCVAAHDATLPLPWLHRSCELMLPWASLELPDAAMGVDGAVME